MNRTRLDEPGGSTIVTAAAPNPRLPTVEALLDHEQERFSRAHPKSLAAWQEGQRHFLYGGPSHWMRRWAGGFPVYAAEAKGTIMSISASATPAACAAMRWRR
jgi:glutamate-1-semialdehyde 2,1-aminomutase